ncbi:dephospho-CoA kinase [Emcibacter sp.]|uniref:dephospho-CoA kinase n=1 Tax=Emcibacter sp. TaxID=1979954 RepID=UPI002AA8A98E|nr:dephospho-CoA kinase [Emcibacter sp.]
MKKVKNKNSVILVGLTGSIGMGKSETAHMFQSLGIPVFDSDAEVHRLMGPGGRAVPLVEKAFPGVSGETGIDRKELGRRVFGDDAALKKLEAILHPMVARERNLFIRRMRLQGHRIVVVDVPLLFETGGDRAVDYTVVVSAPALIQKSRVMARPGMTEQRLQAILEKQMPDVEKRRRADFVVQSGLGKRHARGQVSRIIRILSNQ